MKFALALTAAILAATLSAPAAATLLTFTISGDYAASFQLESAPTPLPENVADGFLFGIADVSGFPTASGLAGVSFFSAGSGGGLLVNDGFDYLLDAAGPQLYTGTESAPTFRLGAFALTGVSTPGNFTVTISAPAPAAVPEPAAWAMLIGGFGATGTMLRYRRRAVTVRHAA